MQEMGADLMQPPSDFMEDAIINRGVHTCVSEEGVELLLTEDRVRINVECREENLVAGGSLCWSRPLVPKHECAVWMEVTISPAEWKRVRNLAIRRIRRLEKKEAVKNAQEAELDRRDADNRRLT